MRFGTASHHAPTTRDTDKVSSLLVIEYRSIECLPRAAPTVSLNRRRVFLSSPTRASA